MPLFEYQCEEHGRFEMLEPRGPGADYAPCVVCDVPAPLMPSLPVMRPDTLWAGQVTNGYGYHTSATSLKREMARRNHVVCGDRTDREGMDKIAEGAQKARDDKQRKSVRKWAERAFGPSGLGLGGADGAKMLKEKK